MTSEKLSSLRTLSDLPIEMRTVAEVRPAVSSISRASARLGREPRGQLAAATSASMAAQLAALLTCGAIRGRQARLLVVPHVQPLPRFVLVYVRFRGHVAAQPRCPFSRKPLSSAGTLYS